MSRRGPAVERGRRLEGKAALVTGASRGIGRATALAFAREGAAVVVNYVNGREEAKRVVETIRGDGGRAIASRADVSKKAEVDAMVAAAIAEFGRIDILVNNAGIFRASNLQSLTPELLDEVLAVNVKGALFCVQAVAPHMVRQRRGRIINISSISSFGTRIGDNTAYSMSKASLNAFTKRAALELGAYDITVNAICSGPVRTDMYVSGPREEVESRIVKIAQRAILRRIGEPEDVAYAALFLASDEAGFITAQLLTVDGGRADFLSHSA